MPKLALSILATCSLVLAGVIAQEWKSGAPESHSPPAPASAATLADPAAKLKAGQHDAAHLDEILARPLFTASRRPPAGGDRAAGSAATAALKGRLAGIVVSPAGSEALFVESGKTKAVSVREGESFEGWTVERIEPEHVMVRAGARLETVEPAGDKARIVPPAPASARSAGFAGAAAGFVAPAGANSAKRQ